MKTEQNAYSDQHVNTEQKNADSDQQVKAEKQITDSDQDVKTDQYADSDQHVKTEQYADSDQHVKTEQNADSELKPTNHHLIHIEQIFQESVLKTNINSCCDSISENNSPIYGQLNNLKAHQYN